MIKIFNKRNYLGDGEYVGRPSLLGNPFKAGRDGTREEVVNNLYRNWLWRQIKSKSLVYDELLRLADVAKNHDLILVCYCFPKLCHANIIKLAIEWINTYGAYSSVGRAQDCGS